VGGRGLRVLAWVDPSPLQTCYLLVCVLDDRLTRGGGNSTLCLKDLKEPSSTGGLPQPIKGGRLKNSDSGVAEQRGKKQNRRDARKCPPSVLILDYGWERTREERAGRVKKKRGKN